MGIVSGCHGTNFPLCMSTLQNIARLAKHSHMWKDDHLKKLHQMKVTVSSNPSTYLRYLDVLVALTEIARPGLITGLYDTLSELGNLGQSECMPMRIRYLQMSSNILCRVPNEHKWQALCGPFMNTVEHELPEHLAKTFYRTLGRFLCCNEVEPEQVLLVLDSILNMPVNHANIVQLIDLCCQIASRLPFSITKLHQWAKSLISKETSVDETMTEIVFKKGELHEKTPGVIGVMSVDVTMTIAEN
ncbi:hypothetical protein KIN20_001237 [Parelaphostrongylus tenuis]|uniref:Uncharacterized protein n=1 Tax=Parelaphostrongylus tenuis TaxID=148309 RepID=A0AAD5MEY5_PARTN|nr:hypothetical protein KIN20_001237 [Parelaphostrongylus tenuis]